MNNLTISIADDHEVIREAIVSLLKKNNSFQVLASKSNGQELMESLQSIGIPDVILLDIDMPVMDGFETLKQIRKKHSNDIKVLILSVHDEYYVVKKMLELGANGYISKRADSSELQHAIDEVVSKEFYLSPELSKLLLKEQYHPRPEGLKITKTEEEILKLVCGQKNTEEIAQQLKLSHHTVNSYRAKLLEKTDSINIAGLVVFAMKMGLFRVD